MAPQPAPGTGGPPTGNALSDANSQGTSLLTPQQLATLGSGLSGSISECLWPPQGTTWGVGTGLINLQFGVPCLFTKSEARAAAGLGLLIGGFILVNWGVGLLVGAKVLAVVTGIAGGGKAGKAPAAGGAAAESASAPAAAEVALAA